MKYQLPKGIDKPPETKTVYDPKIYSDAKMAGMAQEAAARGIQKYMQGGYQPGELNDVNISGVNFKVAVKNITGSQTSANNPANLTVPTVFPGQKER